MKSLNFLLRIGGALAIAGACAPVLADSYPGKLIKIVVPFPAGSDLDPTARGLGEHFRAAWGQPYIVENKPGANAMIGTGQVAKAAGDGHTLLVCSPGPMSINPGLYPKVPYTVGKDIVPVSLVGTTPMVLVASTDLPVKNYAEFVAHLKANAGKVFYASGGTGNITHLVAELFLRQAGVTAIHAPYKGGQAAITDLLGGHVDFYFNPLPSAQGYIHAQKDKVIPLAVTSLERSPFLPNVPSLNELGLKGFEVNSWYGLCAPGGTPAEVLAKLSAETAKALASGTLPERLRSLGTTPQASTPAQFAEQIRKEAASWQLIIKEKNITPD